MICMANATDSGFNLREILSAYRREIDALENLTLKEKTTKLHMLGIFTSCAMSLDFQVQ